MAYEATLVFETAPAIPFTVADGTGIEKGSLLKITDPLTAALSDGSNDVIAGIAATEKIANDGKVKLGVYRQGIFKMTCSGAVPVGAPITSLADANFPNEIGSALGSGLACSGASAFGTALETGAQDETILVDLNIGVGTGTE